MTTRNLTSDYLTALTADSVKIAFLFEGEFASAPLRLWTGRGDLSWAGLTFNGNSWFQGFSGVGETTDIKAINLEVTLTGVPEAVIALALNEASQNKKGRLWLAFLNEDDSVIDDPYLLFEGKLDTAEIQDAADESTVTISYESELIELEKAEEWRFTDISQKTLYPADRGFEYMTSVADWNGFWGVAETKPKDRKNRPPKKPKHPGKRRR